MKHTPKVMQKLSGFLLQCVYNFVYLRTEKRCK